MIIKRDVWIEPFDCERTLHIYLPDDYEESDERYPVMYMYDGHNLFYDEDATYGKSWGLADFLDTYDKKFIVVGLECNHEGTERLSEFSPYSFTAFDDQRIIGKGKELMEWWTFELKPWIDEEYRTMPFRECTGIGGSSMGGLMALYTVLKYNEYFSKAACLSSALYFVQRPMKREFSNVELNPDTKVYLSLGTKESRTKRSLHYAIARNEYYQHIIEANGADCFVNVVDGGKHNEACWELENPVYFDYLWNND